MRAPISVVIPTLDAAEHLPATLAHLMPGLSEGLIRELVISDGGSTDDTARIAEDAGARLVTGAKGRGGQLRRGVAAAQGEWLLVLHADTHLGEGWVGAVCKHLELSPDKAGYFRLAFRSSHPGASIVARGANLRTRWFHLPYGDQGLLISRELYDRIGGYPDQPLMEDVEIARKLGSRLSPLAATAHTGADRYEQAGWLRQASRNLWRLARYRFGAGSEGLAQGYDKAAPKDH
jgi:rSAM/selenodomain-associated transferase 2